MSVSAAASNLGITDETYYRWRTRYGSLSEEEAKRLRELDEERARLRRVIEEQAQDIAMLQDLTQGEIPSAVRQRLAVAYLVDHYGISERRACRVVGEHRSTRTYGLTGAGDDEFADDWAAGDEDLDDEMARPEPGPQSGSDETWRGAGRGSGAPRRGHDDGGGGRARSRLGTGRCSGPCARTGLQDPAARRPVTGSPPGADEPHARPRVAGAVLGNGATGGVGWRPRPPSASRERSLPPGPVLWSTSGASYGLRAGRSPDRPQVREPDGCRGRNLPRLGSRVGISLHGLGGDPRATPATAVSKGLRAVGGSAASLSREPGI